MADEYDYTQMYGDVFTPPLIGDENRGIYLQDDTTKPMNSTRLDEIQPRSNRDKKSHPKHNNINAVYKKRESPCKENNTKDMYKKLDPHELYPMKVIIFIVIVVLAAMWVMVSNAENRIKQCIREMNNMTMITNALLSKQ